MLKAWSNFLWIKWHKPYAVGDYVMVGKERGRVEEIRFPFTRLRSLSGEEFIISNTSMLEIGIKNFKQLQERRVLLRFSLSFDTPIEKLKKVPEWLRVFISRFEQARFERSHLIAHGQPGAPSLDFETVYWVKDLDIQKHLDIQQGLYYMLLTKMAQEKLSFALPIRVNVSYEPGVVFANEEDDFDIIGEITFNDRNN